MTKQRMLILDFTPKHEGMSEGTIISEFIKISNIINENNIYVEYNDRLPRKKDILKLFNDYEWDYIHISAHANKTAFGLPKGNGKIDLKDLFEIEFHCKLLLSTGCNTGTKDFGDKMIECGCESYIAPNKEVYYNDSVLFSLLVYNHIFYESSAKKPNLKSINAAFDKAILRYEKGSFQIFPRALQGQ